MLLSYHVEHDRLPESRLSRLPRLIPLSFRCRKTTTCGNLNPVTPIVEIVPPAWLDCPSLEQPGVAADG